MKRLLIALALILFPSIASAQCNGVFQPGFVCGVALAESARPAHALLSTLLPAGTLVIGSTPISGGTSQGLLYNNAAVLGNASTILLNSAGGLNITTPVTGTYSAPIFQNLLSSTDTAIITTQDFSTVLGISQIFGGASVRGGREALIVSTALNSTTSVSNTNRNYVGIVGVSTAAANDGGTPGAKLGAFFATNFIARATGSATNIAQLTGSEVNISAEAGSSVAYKAGWTIVQSASDVVAGQQIDAAMVFSNQVGSIGWTDGLLLANPNGQHPLTVTGSVIRSVGGNFAYGLNLAASTMGASVLSPNTVNIKWRNAANTLDVGGMLLDSNDNINIGNGNFSGTVFIFGNTSPNTNNALDLGGPGDAWRQIYTYGMQATGSSSGVQLWKAAAVASGTITWPAGTVDFSGTGGTSRVVKQTSAGGIFTVAQLACSDLSGVGTGCSAAAGITALTGDGTATGPGSVALTFATVNSNVGTFGSATQASQVTVNGKGLVTAAANVTVTPAVGSITGLGTGVATALATNVGSAGAFVTFNGALGTPSSGTVTNLTGTASININGTVGATTPTTAAVTTLNASSTSTLTGNVGIGAAPLTGSKALLLSAVSPYIVFNDTGATATNKDIGLVYLGSTLGNPGIVIQSLDDSGGFVASNSVIWRDGGASFGSIGYPTSAGSVLMNVDVYAPNLPTTTGALGAALCWTATTGRFQRDTNAGGCLVSSARYKHDIAPLTSSLDTVMAMRPVSFVYNDSVGVKGQQIGFIAEQIAQVDDRLVGFNPDGSAQSVKYMQATAVIVGAIQQLKADNENLTDRIARLETHK